MPLHFGFNEQEEYVPPPELIEGLVSDNSLNFVYGYPGVGKSIFLAELAACLAEGREFFSHHCAQSLVIIACEEDFNGMREKNAAVHHKKMLSGFNDNVIGTLGDEGLRLIGDIRPTIETINGAFYEAEEHLIRRTGKVPDKSLKKVLIIDTLASLCPGVDENSSKDMSTVLEGLRQIKASGINAIFVAHHCGKDASSRLRGHSNLEGRADNVWRLRKSREQTQVYVEKAKHHRNGAEFWFEIATTEVLFQNAGVYKSLPYLKQSKKRDANSCLSDDEKALMEIISEISATSHSPISTLELRKIAERRFGYGDGRGEAFRKKFKRLLDGLSAKERLLIDDNNGVCLEDFPSQEDDNAT